MIALAIAALTMGPGGAGAQERQPPASPDLRMLLNLDLFRPHPSDAANGASDTPSNGSMLDQIRTLKAMGYLRANQPANQDVAGPMPGAADVSGARATTPNRPPSDSEGQP